MNKFYAIANTKSGESKLISFEDMGKNAPKWLYQAEKIAKQYSEKNGLIFQGAYVSQGTQKQPQTITKFKKLRTKTGNNGKYFAKSL
ncbi:hypothetical protein D3C74_364940 [compost metagenome]